MRIEVRCPYCGFINTVFVEKDYCHPKVVTCDIDEGGCERDFVLKVKKEISTETFKIEGEE